MSQMPGLRHLTMELCRSIFAFLIFFHTPSSGGLAARLFPSYICNPLLRPVPNSPVPPMTIGSTSSSLPRKRKKPAPKSDEQKAAQRQARHDANKAYHEALADAIRRVGEIVSNVAITHRKAYDDVASDLSLTMKEFNERRAPNIYNAYNFCWARVDRGEWANNPSKKQVIEIIKEGEANGGHETLSEDQREVLLQVLRADHEERDTGIVRKPMKQLHDIRTTLEKVKGELDGVHQRSGLEFILLASRSRGTQLSAPSVYTSDQGADFLLQVIRMSPVEVSQRFEAFSIGHAGIQGVIKHLAQQSAGKDRKGATKALIQEILHEQMTRLAGRAGVRIEYANWYVKMILRLHINMRRWPLNGPPINPSEIKTSKDMTTLYQALFTGTCCLYRISDEEMAIQRATPGGLFPMPAESPALPALPSPPVAAAAPDPSSSQFTPPPAPPASLPSLSFSIPTPSSPAPTPSSLAPTPSSLVPTPSPPVPASFTHANSLPTPGPACTTSTPSTRPRISSFTASVPLHPDLATSFTPPPLSNLDNTERQRHTYPVPHPWTRVSVDLAAIGPGGVDGQGQPRLARHQTDVRRCGDW
ncbi:hypothetical protein OF83DRAFT_132359 [Amylostereum chailletii]|nr:hypothetical protein OF83DRAFT_132359 [Amylostereum chailletii]